MEKMNNLDYITLLTKSKKLQLDKNFKEFFYFGTFIIDK